jgi:hypothetical protein
MSNQLIDKRTEHKVERTRKDRDIEQMLMHIGEKPKGPRKGFRQHKEDKELKLMLNCPGLFFQDPSNPISKPDPNAPRTKYKRQTDYAFKAQPKITKDTILNDIKTKEDEEEKAKVKAEAKEKEKAEIAEIKAKALTLVSLTTKKAQDDETKVKEEAIEKMNAEARAYEKAEANKVKEIAETKAKEKAEIKAKAKEKFLAKLKANIKAQSDKVKSKS